MSIDVKQFRAAQIAEDALHFRYLVEKADPRQLVTLLNGSRSLDDWRSVLSEMEAKGE